MEDRVHAQLLACASAAEERLSPARRGPALHNDRGLLDNLRLCDYPLLHWLSRLFFEMPDGVRTGVFDLGGHVRIVYYAFRKCLDYPAQLRWTVHDVPNVIEAG